jgi:hypothetical protein
MGGEVVARNGEVGGPQPVEAPLRGVLEQQRDDQR